MSTANTTTFAAEIIDLCFEGSDTDTIDIDTIEEIAVRNGLLVFRKPTPAELSDTSWWGHEYDIGPDDEGVVERTPDFQAMLPEVEEAAA